MTALVRSLLIVLLGVGAFAMGGDPAAARGAQEPASPAATPTPKPAPTPTPTPTARPEEQLEKFVPSEKLPADQAVAFPVDI
jgi:hypothetical protein